MPLVTRITHTGFIWIPRPFIPTYKLEIIRDSGTTDDLTERILFLEFDRPVTEEIGKFEVHIDNNDEQYTNIYNGGEIVRIYIDMSDATTKQFEGIVENVKNEFNDIGNILNITGTHVSSELIDITVTASYTDMQISGTAASILNDLVSEYLTGYTTNNVIANTAIATINWSHKSFWDCIRDLCRIADYDCYVDNDKDIHFFARNSIETTLDAVVWDDNLISVEGLGIDIADVRNKIIIYGGNDDAPIIYTKSDSSSQTDYKIKELVIKDSAIKTETEAEDRADAELELLKEPELKGVATTQGMIYANPGEKIWISIPPQKIHAQYRILKIIHRIESDFETQLEVSKVTKGIPKFFKDRSSKELAIQKIENPNKLEYSYYFSFDSDAYLSHSNTETNNGKLRLVSGQTTGTMTTTAKVTINNVANVELRTIGQSLRDSTYQVSADNGVTWQTITPNIITSITNTGKYLKVKANLVSNSDNPNPEIDTLSCLYK